MSKILRDAVETRRDEAQNELDALLARVKREQRNSLTDAEELRYEALFSEIQALDDRIDEGERSARRAAGAAEVRRIVGGGGSFHTSPRGGEVYRPNGEHSFFRDLRAAKLGNVDAAQRLSQNEAEQRALGNTGAVGGSGGDFAPPGYVLDAFAALARPGRVLADRCTKDDLPAGISSVNVPKLLTGSTNAVQTTQNTALSATDPTTSTLSSGIVTIGGKVVVSQQLLDQSGIPFDRIILSDLAADYTRALGAQVITGSGTSGQLTGLYTYFQASGTANVTWTQASPTIPGFYGQVAKAIAQITTSRYLPPTDIVMHPRRWAWLAGASDSNGRPYIVPDGDGFNSIAQQSGVVAQGRVGSLAGLSVWVDPNIPTNLGTGTNQDAVFVGRFEDCYLWESSLRMETFPEPYADSAGVLYRTLGYSAFIPGRYTSAVAVIGGTGLTPPAYVS